jgi:Icc protein
MTPTRREFLGITALAGLGLDAVASPVRAAEPSVAGSRKRQLRIAHLTDMHVQPELEAARGLESCFAHVQTLAERGLAPADMILTGGDTIMDSLAADMGRTKTQWSLWKKAKSDHCSLDIKSVIGNHDVWGWTQSRANTKGDEPLYGKKWACEEFGRALPWESFDKAGWHVVLLDSTFPHKDSYIGKLDDAQWDWLEQDLASIPATVPILLVSHIPILSAYPVAVTKPVVGPDGRPDIEVAGNLVHTDLERFQKLFAKHKNVKACISGHLHVVEQIDYGGVRYLCSGAVSGGWWRGLHRGTDFGYSLVDLYDDGTVESTYVAYGWQARS